MRDFSTLRLALFAATVWLLNAAAARAAEQALTLAGLKVTVWSDETGGAAKQPVIIFSHGFHGCATQSRFLMEAFAAAGYIVLAPNHHDATCNGGEASWLGSPALRFRQPRRWDQTTYRDRAEDIRNLIEARPTTVFAIALIGPASVCPDTRWEDTPC